MFEELVLRKQTDVVVKNYTRNSRAAVGQEETTQCSVGGVHEANRTSYGMVCVAQSSCIRSHLHVTCVLTFSDSHSDTKSVQCSTAVLWGP